MKVATLARAAALGVVLRRLAPVVNTRPPVTVAEPPTRRTISVVIPARNEATSLGPLLEVVVGAPGVDEVIVVDDESSDGTAELAARSCAHVIAVRRPDGWAGKPWALQCGLDAAAGDWVVTLDADTRPSPELPAAVVSRAEADGTDLLTVAGRFEGGSAAARWLQAAMLATLVYRFGPPGQSPRPAGRRLLANGQCMAIRKDTLIGDGGFGPVAGSVVEDVALARHLAALGRRVDFLDASQLLHVGVPDSLAATWAGWGRSIGLPGVEPGWRQCLELAVLALTLPLPLARLLTGRADPVDLIALVARVGTLVGTRTAFTPTDRAYWASPVADAVAVVAVVKSMLIRRHVWSGRHYRLN